jgi:hypothetical protein
MFPIYPSFSNPQFARYLVEFNATLGKLKPDFRTAENVGRTGFVGWCVSMGEVGDRDVTCGNAPVRVDQPEGETQR